MLNPITYTENVIGDFLRYQLTTYPFADENLYAQMRQLLNLEETRATPLMRGPYIKLSPTFRQGASIESLIAEGILHPGMRGLTPYPSVFGHQETALRAIHRRQHTVVSTGTGSGKTETFLYPIISHCLALRDQHALPGIVAVVVYPMNALAEDQLGRLRELLTGSGISFGMYIGKTPETKAEVTGLRLPPGASQADYQVAIAKARQDKKNYAIYPVEERPSRVEMREDPPRILLTNVKQLELLLTRQRDVELFNNVHLDYLVFDEAHTFSGAAGAETAALIRRLRTFCGRSAGETICIATSATIVDPTGDAEAGRTFASRFFGVDPHNVALVTEEYDRREIWAEQRHLPPALAGNPALHLRNILEALEDDNVGQRIHDIFQAMTGQVIDPNRWSEGLYDRLAANELVYQLVALLTDPRTLTDLVVNLEKHVGRTVLEEEILIWLALGAAARQNDRPFLRPVIHAFVRGVGGAVVTFPPDQNLPQLYLSAETVPTAFQSDRLYLLPVATCTTCGQHYFIHHLADFTLTGQTPEGGQQVGHSRLWKPLDPANGGRRVLLLDHLTTGDPEEDDPETPATNTPLYFCRACGTVHLEPETRCANCGRAGELVRLFAVPSKDTTPGYLSSCVACKARGGRRVGGYREPIRPIRAVTVSDVHVLAQNMIQHAERRRLLVFADNRQDAAFQAGWMQDHARRFRLRSLMYEHIRPGPISVGDLTARLDRVLDEDDALSRVLLPEVWREHTKEAAGLEHSSNRKYFLRIQILREIVTGVRQRLGLEPWGRIQVQYLGLTSDLPFMQRWAQLLKLEPEILVAGVASLLDNARRNGILLDRQGHIFSCFWSEGRREIQQGYLPMMPNIPRALKLHREANDNRNRVNQWLSDKGSTLAKQAARRWGVPPDSVEAFIEELWHLLADELQLLAPVAIVSQWNKPASGFSQVYQIDADRLRIVPTTRRGVYRCRICRRSHSHPTPHMVCMAWQCQGTLQFEPETGDDYDLRLLDQQFTMVRSREHSAQVPATEREVLERMFKGESEQVNTLVCTPTLELGVDIGALDAVLMRNVPPLPANYWQRVGRAGRRHRMAVNLTYARPASHDQAYYRAPLKLLQGLILPPRFNLRNELMVEKHIHAVVLTTLHQLARAGSDLPAAERAEITATLNHCFPAQIKPYLFDEQGHVRSVPLEVTLLGDLITKHQEPLLKAIQTIFAQGWPADAASAVTSTKLLAYLAQTDAKLAEVILRLWRRLQWALSQMDRLDAVRQRKGTLDPDEDALRARCDRLVKRLKGLSRRRNEAEGHDDTNTYSVLAAEGFLPGYGLETGSIKATTQIPPSLLWLKDFDLPRPSALALREYVPGNLIYANGHRFFPRFYHLEPDEPAQFRVDLANQAVVEIGTGPVALGPGLSATDLLAIPICDVDLPHQAHINDDEDYRFQLGVSVFGYEQDRHNGGKGYQWGSKNILLRHGVHLRLVNVGVANLLPEGRLGYPVCLVCGQSRSPLASEADRAKFAQDHQERCGQSVQPVGFFADVVADALTLQNCANRQEAYSVMEALRMGAAQVLEMEVEDLQTLVIGQAGSEAVDAWLYDPMPGGSGLLEQMLERWAEVVQAALGVVQGCSAACDTACIDCLYSFRNAFYHRYLNRHAAAQKLVSWGQILTFSHDLPANLPTTPAEGTGAPVNQPEVNLLAMLLRAGFPEPQAQYSLDLGRPLGTTIPDFFYEDPKEVFEGVCIYLDGMSGRLHGNAATRQRDRQIRDELRNRDYQVIEIPYGDLTDRAAMAAHFYRLGRILIGKTRATEIRDRTEGWFVEEGDSIELT
ncbi:MAG: DEAD/DEAH box helicase [Anaerolineae bacterium]|nr:DEAD/DEAH box helicase [Anaerolineae bacterium]